MKKIARMCSLAWLALIISASHANNISVSNVTLEDQSVTGHYCYVEFDLSWDNSWRTSSIPQNWDAAWVFVKYRLVGGEWYHASLHADNHTAPSGSTINVPSGALGVFIYRDSDGNGNNNWQNVRLRWDYGDDGVADDASIEVKVFAIEMVYVPQGDFRLGDGAADNRFYLHPTNTNPYLVTSAPVTLGPSSGSLNGGAMGTGVSGTTVSSLYPIGYNAYYCMKYEISQEQYVDFLNTLTRLQQNARTQTDVSADALPVNQNFVMSAGSSPAFRNGITCASSGLGTTDPITFYCDFNNNGTGNESDDGHNIPCNFLCWMDLAAYADWAALRPLTETEFEKACRGPNTPVANEYAWGSVSIHASDYSITFSGSASEVISDPGVNTGNALFFNTKLNFDGPGRCGIFAASSSNHTRLETGAGYYGIMEMSGNVYERLVCIFYLSGLSYTGLHGDGSLLASGDANVDYWPGINGNADYNVANGVYGGTTGITAVAGSAFRGGAFTESNTKLFLSDRSTVLSGNAALLTNRNGTGGGRFARTAP